MSIGYLMSRDSVLLFTYAEAPDQSGDLVADWGTGVEHPAVVRPISQSEDGQDQIGVSRFRVFVAANTVVGMNDEVEWRDGRYQIIGEPLVREGPYGPVLTSFEIEVART